MPYQPISHPYGPPKNPPPHGKPLPQIPRHSTRRMPAAEPRRPPPLKLRSPAMNAPASTCRRPSANASQLPKPFVNPNPRPPGVPVGGVYYGKNGPPARADGHPPRTSSLQKPVMVQAKEPQKGTVVQPATRIKSSQAYVYRSSQPPRHKRFSFEPKKMTAKEIAAKKKEAHKYCPGKRTESKRDFLTGMPEKVVSDQNRYKGKVEMSIRRDGSKKGSGCIVM